MEDLKKLNSTNGWLFFEWAYCMFFVSTPDVFVRASCWSGALCRLFQNISVLSNRKIVVCR
jgi:hypothetical protein